MSYLKLGSRTYLTLSYILVKLNCGRFFSINDVICESGYRNTSNKRLLNFCKFKGGVYSRGAFKRKGRLIEALRYIFSDLLGIVHISLKFYVVSRKTKLVINSLRNSISYVLGRNFFLFPLLDYKVI